MLAFDFGADGWYLRRNHLGQPRDATSGDRSLHQKPRTDFPTGEVGQLFGYCDMEAIGWSLLVGRPRTRQPHAQGHGLSSRKRRTPPHQSQAGGVCAGASAAKAASCFRGSKVISAESDTIWQTVGDAIQDVGAGDTRNKRSVWTVPKPRYKGAHFATLDRLMKAPSWTARAGGPRSWDPFLAVHQAQVSPSRSRQVHRHRKRNDATACRTRLRLQPFAGGQFDRNPTAPSHPDQAEPY